MSVQPSWSESADPVFELSSRLQLTAEANARAAELLVDLEHTRLRLEQQNSELEEARRAAEESARCKSIFLATMSHELRTPLNAIIGYSEMLGEDAELQGLTGLVKDLGRIRSAGRHLLGLINDILDFSKIEAGRMTITMESVPVLPLFEEVLSTAIPLARVRSNCVRLDCANPDLLVQADRLRLTQCLLNLLSNSARFTTNGEIRLTARGMGPVADLAVMDTGIGIADEFAPQLFEPFTQADATGVRAQGGTGLGLAISRNLARLMGGDLTFDSAPGAGSTFTIRLNTA